MYPGDDFRSIEEAGTPAARISCGVPPIYGRWKWSGSLVKGADSMEKGLQWLSLVACFLLGTVIACVLMVQNWHKVSVIPVVKAQDAPVAGKKYVDVEPDSPRFAARVVKVTVGSQVVTPGYFRYHKGPSGAPFQAGDDWLKEMTFTIKNRSSKTFVFISFDIVLSEALASARTIGKVVELGRVPEVDAYTVEGNKIDQGSQQPLDFRPGQEMEISVAPYADELRGKIEEIQPFSTANRCFINVAVGYFEDGMQWMLMDYSVPDPSHPGSFKPVDDSEIPVRDKRATYA